ncbi:MAG: O-antigen ligase family protein [Bacteroidales bacterium]|nr:O-antigen ligase family protein [Bacteroidales bacterium]
MTQDLKTWFKKNKTATIAVAVALLFSIINAIMLSKDFYLLIGIPLLGLIVMLFVFKLETGLMATALFTPFAIDFALFPGMELSMPVEPMMILFSCIFMFRVLVAKTYNTAILKHPVSLSIFAMLIWMLITSITSEMPQVSFKYLAARFWFMIPFFFAATQVFRSTIRIKQFFWCYAVSLITVILISTVKTMSNFSDLQTLHRVMKPFYNDHTAYGVAIALFVPVAFFLAMEKQKNPFFKTLTIAALVVLIIGLGFSYSRAAWISVVGAIAVYYAIKMGMKIKWMLVIAAVGVAFFFTYQADVLYKLGKNNQDSSYNLADQVKSISNISTDASNVERLNRWASALRMFEERPITGWGPGTYQFIYGKYQRSYQLSTISTNSGNLGNAHSEYIGPLADQGVLGTLFTVLVFGLTFATGIKVYRTARSKRISTLAIAFTLGLFTYYVHGIFNNFLDTDKLSVPFWGFTAAIVALDVYFPKKEESC